MCVGSRVGNANSRVKELSRLEFYCGAPAGGLLVPLLPPSCLFRYFFLSMYTQEISSLCFVFLFSLLSLLLVTFRLFHFFFLLFFFFLLLSFTGHLQFKGY